MSTTTTTHSDPPASSRRSLPDLLEPGDRMSRPEFLRRYRQMPDRSDIELVEGVVHMGSPVSAEGHGAPHAKLLTWLGLAMVVYIFIALQLAVSLRRLLPLAVPLSAAAAIVGVQRSKRIQP